MYTDCSLSVLQELFRGLFSAVNKGSTNNNRTMAGMLPSDPSLAMRLAMRNAFIFRAPKAAPADSTGSKQALAITPLGVVGERPSTGGALTRLCDNDDMEARQRLPRALSVGCYRGWGSRAICPLYMIKGVQDGNTTTPVGEGAGGVDGEDPGLDEGTETALTTHCEHDDGTHGILDASGLSADADLGRLYQQQRPCEDSSNADKDDSFDTNTDANSTDGELPQATDNRIDKVSLTLNDAADGTMGYVSRDVVDSGSALNEQDHFDVAANDVSKESSLEPFDDEVDKEMPRMLPDAMPDTAALKAVVLGDAVNNLVWAVLDDALVEGTASEAQVLDYVMEPMMWSKLHDAICGRATSDQTDLTAALDGVFTCLLHKAFFGSAASTAITSLTESAHGSELVVQTYVRAVSELYRMIKEVRIGTVDDTAFDEDPSLELATDGVADDATRTVLPDNDHSVFGEEFPFHFALGDVIDEISFGPFGLVPVEEVVDDDEMLLMLDDIDDRELHERNPFDITNDGAVDWIRLGSYGPMVPVLAIGDKMPLLHGAMSDGAISKVVDDLVRSVLENAFNRGEVSKDLMLDSTMDYLLWAKLHDAICGREVSDPTNDADALDDMFTYLLHKAFFGPEAAKAITPLAKNDDDRKLVVKEYTRAVSRLYDKLKQMRVKTKDDQQAKDPKPDSEAPVTRKVWRARGAWFKNLWERIRRKGQG